MSRNLVSRFSYVRYLIMYWRDGGSLGPRWLLAGKNTPAMATQFNLLLFFSSFSFNTKHRFAFCARPRLPYEWNDCSRIHQAIYLSIGCRCIICIIIFVHYIWLVCSRHGASSHSVVIQFSPEWQSTIQLHSMCDGFPYTPIFSNLMKIIHQQLMESNSSVCVFLASRYIHVYRIAFTVLRSHHGSLYLYLSPICRFYCVTGISTTVDAIVRSWQKSKSSCLRNRPCNG